MYGYYFDAIFNNKHVLKPQRARTTVIAHIMRMRVYRIRARETIYADATFIHEAWKKYVEQVYKIIQLNEMRDLGMGCTMRKIMETRKSP